MGGLLTSSPHLFLIMNIIVLEEQEREDLIEQGFSPDTMSEEDLMRIRIYNYNFN